MSPPVDPAHPAAASSPCGPDSPGCEMLRALARLFACPGFEGGDSKALVFALRAGPAVDYRPGDPFPPAPEIPMVVRLEHHQQVRYTIGNVRDRRGNPANFDGVPSWESSNPTVVAVTADADGMGAWVRSSDANGEAQLAVRGDARQGDEVVPVVGFDAVVVAPSDVVAFDLNAGEIEDLPTEGGGGEPPAEPAPS